MPIIDSIIAAFSKPFIIEQREHKIAASIGATFYPQEDEDVDGDLLLRQADLAMYQAKQSGKNRYHIFDAKRDESIRSKHKMVEKIKAALSKNEFVLYFQPKVNIQTHEILGAEALIRWRMPDGGLLYPLDFLLYIEDELISIELGEWVIKEALLHLECFKTQGLAIHISVNISALHLLSQEFVTRLEMLLGDFLDINPNSLEIEILETSALENIEAAIDVIRKCKHLGVAFSLDDFGTGYSSLSYLKRLTISTLKIDQSFI